MGSRFLLPIFCVFLLSAALSGADSVWRFSNGPEFKGASGELTPVKDGFRLRGDFANGGSYVAMTCREGIPPELMLLRFSVKTAADRIAVRITDSDGQTHQHFLPLAGKDGWEEIALRVAGSVEHHWGGRNDGTLRPPVRQVAIVTHRGDYGDSRRAEVEVKNIRFDSVRPQSEHGFVMPQELYQNHRFWRFSNGPEFKGAGGSLEFIPPGTLRLNGDFTAGGSYVAMRHSFAAPVPLTAAAFKVKSASKGTDVRFVDSDGQTHQHYVTLSGNPDEVQEVVLPVAGSPRHHWGGKNDGVLRQPVREVHFAVHGSELPGKKGALDYSDIRFYTSDHTLAGKCGFAPVAPESLFRAASDCSPVELRLFSKPDVPADALGAFYITDYQGRKIHAGNSAKYDAERMVLTFPAFPGYAGFLEYHLPALGIRFGVQQTAIAPKEPDEFFAIDSSFSWGAILLSEPQIRSYCRILKQNGIVWNRDRLSWSQIQPEEGAFRYGGNFALYRKIASEEGIKTLDTFHDTPAWLRPSRNEKKFGPTPFPSRLREAGKSWAEIVRHYQPTLQALEVWNEPDIGFGAYLPAERVSSLTKAVSRALREAGLDTVVVGGVFATPWPGTAFQDAYLANALLDTCDVMSYHTYAGVEAMEPTVGGLRERELALGHPRAGIPIWLTESGTPWFKRGERAVVSEDIASAAGIVGKALEFKALGVERYFAFEYKYYQEGEKNFGMMDFYHTPMRSMAAYACAARLFAGKEYKGDLAGVKAARRARVFGDGKEAAVFFYQPDGKAEVVLPKGLSGTLLGIDGRPLPMKDGVFRCPDRVAYLILPEKALAGRINADTRAMKYHKMAQKFDRAPRKTAPVVFRSVLDMSNMTFNPFGYNVRDFRDARFDVELQNCSGEPQTVRPVLEVPAGVRVLENVSDEVRLAPGETGKLAFRVAIDPGVDKGKFKLLRLSDRNGNALPFAFSVRPWEMLITEVPPLPENGGTYSKDELLAAGDWNDFSSAEHWKSWQGGEIEPNIAAKFRAFHDKEKLQLQVLVKDESFRQPYPAHEAWRGDSLQVALQQRGEDGLPPARRYWNEVTVAQTGKTGTIYGHRGNPAGLTAASKLKFVPLGDGCWLYVVDFDAKEFALDLSPGSKIGFSLLVNSNSGKGRDGFLAWGSGIADGKSPDVFHCLELK